MLLPALARAKMKAQQINCVSNAKQLTMATFMYVNDNGFFVAYSNPNLPGSSLWMGTLIEYYAKTHAVRLCPVAREKAPLPASNTAGACDTAWTWTSSTPTLTGSYALNGWLYQDKASFRSDIPNPENLLFKKEASLQKPSLTPVVMDSVWVDLWPLASDPPPANLYLCNGTANPPTIARCVTPRHGWKSPSAAPTTFDIRQRLPGAIDMGFADGHAAMPKLEQLWEFYWHLNYVPPAKRPGL